jgi:hypothetical protein
MACFTPRGIGMQCARMPIQSCAGILSVRQHLSSASKPGEALDIGGLCKGTATPGGMVPRITPYTAVASDGDRHATVGPKTSRIPFRSG